MPDVLENVWRGYQTIAQSCSAMNHEDLLRLDQPNIEPYGLQVFYDSSVPIAVILLMRSQIGFSRSIIGLSENVLTDMLPLLDQLRTYCYTNKMEIPSFLAA